MTGLIPGFVRLEGKCADFKSALDDCLPEQLIGTGSSLASIPTSGSRLNPVKQSMRQEGHGSGGDSRGILPNALILKSTDF